MSPSWKYRKVFSLQNLIRIFKTQFLLLVNNIVIITENLGNTAFPCLLFLSTNACMLLLRKLFLKERHFYVSSDRKTCSNPVKQCSFRNEKHLSKCSPSAIRTLKDFHTEELFPMLREHKRRLIFSPTKIPTHIFYSLRIVPGRAGQLTPVIPAIWEAKVGGSQGHELETILVNMVKPRLY